MTRLLVCGILLVASVLRSHGFVVSLSNGDPYRWNLTATTSSETNIVNPQTKAIRFFLASDGYSANNTAAELNALRSAFGQWQSIPGTALKFEDGGLAPPQTGINNDDNTNSVFWLKGTTFNGIDDMSGVLALTYTATLDSEVVEADIVLNGAQFRWFTDFFATNETSAYFVEGTISHEIGHFTGLDHSPLGGATMFARGGTGISPQAGLSSDEVAWARWAYPATGTAATLGIVRGTVRKNGVGILGAAIIAEDDLTGNAVSGTLTHPDGSYDLPALPPGNYSLRVTPLDPAVSERLLAGFDIVSPDFNNSDINFLPVAGIPQTITAGVTNTLNFNVTNQPPPFRITGIRPPSTNPNLYAFINSPTTLYQGQRSVYVGVYSPGFDTNCTLTVTGGGLELGSTIFTATPFPGNSDKLLSIVISVATNAVPGLRSFVVTRGTNVAYANGFIEVTPTIPDFNFDGLDDYYQRRYFPLFTSAQAAPNADPDGDGQSNLQEYLAGTNPTDPASLLRIESARQTSSGTTITWQSDVAKHYQILTRDTIVGSPWKTNTVVLGTGPLTSYLDPAATNRMRFYRVQAVP